MKKINKNGFTLIEVIVVLAILAIMAAMAIPTMNGFIEEAKNKQDIAEVRTAYLAAQMVATINQTPEIRNQKPEKEFQSLRVKTMLIADLDIYDVEVTDIVVEEGSKVTKLVYKKNIGANKYKYYTWDINSDKITIN